MDQPNRGGDNRTFPFAEQARNDTSPPGEPSTEDMTCDRCGATFDNQKALQDHVHSHEAMTERRAA
jgi:hypothetical protein